MNGESKPPISLEPVTKRITEKLVELREARKVEQAREEPDRLRLLELQRGILGLESAANAVRAACLGASDTQTHTLFIID